MAVIDPSVLHDDDEHEVDVAVKTKPRKTGLLVLGAAVLIAGGLLVGLRGSGVATSLIRIVNPDYKMIYYAPRASGSVPAQSDVGVDVDGELLVEVDVHKSTLDPATVNTANIALFRTDDFKRMEVSVSLSPDTKEITVKPSQPLAAGTNYTLRISDGIKNKHGKSFIPFVASFNTKPKPDPAIRFEKVELPIAGEGGFTSLVMGAEGKLYAGTDDGRLIRFGINPDGTLSSPETFTAFKDANGGSRLILGFCFDPSSTPQNPIIWVTSGLAMFENCPDFSCKLTRISGSNFDQIQDVLVNLPRAIRDHQSHQPSFGPDGALYFQQGSSSAFGAPDPEWGDRPEHLLTAALLRLDVSKLPTSLPLDVKTVDSGGSYDPRKADAPLTVYASGIRLAYDMCWHSNGHLYLPVNGSSAGGNTPGKGNVPALKKVAMTEHDWLFRIEKGRYYGHPNPEHERYVMNGGNPTGDFDRQEIPFYPVGTKPEADWVPATFDFGSHISANGCIEYKSPVFGGKLQGMLMVCRYNVGSDILALKFDEKGDVSQAVMGIKGLTGFKNPLDITEDPRTGCLYIAEYGARKMTLARPVVAEVTQAK